MKQQRADRSDDFGRRALTEGEIEQRPCPWFGHRWREVAKGESYYRHFQCLRCHDRKVVLTSGHSVANTLWLRGLAWDAQPPLPRTPPTPTNMTRDLRESDSLRTIRRC